jgi:hypothetical protein
LKRLVKTSTTVEQQVQLQNGEQLSRSCACSSEWLVVEIVELFVEISISLSTQGSATKKI